MIIADKPILRIFTTLKNFFPVVIRMIVYPVLILLIFKVTNISTMIPDGKNILMITYLAAIAPACATVTSMAQLYKKDMIYSSELYVLTTIFSIITMPVLIGFYNKCI
jgi:predicted permease